MLAGQSIRIGDPRLPIRFWKWVQPTLDGCWIWAGALYPSGYGHWTIGKRLAGYEQHVRAHRHAYSVLVAPVPRELETDHLCRVRACVNPAHLELVTGAENTRRGVSQAALNARKTECLRGHPFNEKNTHWRPDGKRRCRACRKVYEGTARLRSTSHAL